MFYSKKVHQPAGCTVQKHVELCISHFCFRCFPVCVCRISHRFLQYFCRLSTFCTCRLGLAFVFQLCAGVWGGWGGGGDDVHANATFVFCFWCSPCSGLILVRYIGGEGGGCTDDDASDVADAAIAFRTK